MADIINDGMTKVAYVPTIASTAGPTVAELNAGVALESYITELEDDSSNESVDTTALSSTYETSLPGRRTLATSLTMKFQGAASAPYSTLAGTPDGYLVIRRFVASDTAWTAGQSVDVFTVQYGQRNELAVAANEVLKFKVDIAHTATPVYESTVAA
jgi:hypothetical protein